MRALRALFIAVGLLFAGAALLALLFVPWSLDHFSGEPEDFWALAFCAALAATIATVSFAIVWAIGRRLEP